MTKRQHDFCIAYVACRNVKEACITAGYTEAYSKTKGYTLLKNTAIMEEIATLSEKFYRSQFEELAVKAVKELNSVITDSENRSSQLRAIMYILDVTGVTPESVGIPKPKTVFEVIVPEDLRKRFDPDYKE